MSTAPRAAGGDLRPLFAPSSIAVLGASEGKFFSDSLVRSLLARDPRPTTYLVNPRREHAYGEKVYPSLAAIPGRVDCVVSLLPAGASIDAIQEAAAHGVRAAVVVASGFAEAGPDGAEQEARLVAAAREHGIALAGPNCNGVIGVPDWANLFVGPQYCLPRPGPVALISQSGALVPPTILAGEARGMGWSCIVSSGNEAVLDVCDYLEHCLHDTHTRVTCLLLEQIRDVERFASLAREAAALRHPLVALKLGRSTRGQELAASHTGAVAGEAWMYESLLERLGVIVVRSLDAVLDTAVALGQLTSLPAPRSDAGTGLSVISVSGGASEMAADLAEDGGINLASWEGLDPTTVPDGIATLGNPLDLTGFVIGDQSSYDGLVDELLAHEPTQALVVVWDVHEQHRRWFERFPGLAERPGTVIVLTSAVGFPLEDWARDWVREERVVVGHGLEGTMRALAWWQRQGAGDRGPSPATISATTVELRARAVPQGFRDTLALLRDAGLPLAPCWYVEAEADVHAIVPPEADVCIAKLADVPHRTAFGAVRGPVSRAALPAACAELRRLAEAHGLPSEIVVQPFVRGDVEVYVGALRHPHFGPVLLAGIGGYLLEPLHQVAVHPLPATHEELRAWLPNTPLGPLLAGYRGTPGWDPGPLVDVMLGTARALDMLGERARAIDINPVIVTGERCVVVDALIDPATAES